MLKVLTMVASITLLAVAIPPMAGQAQEKPREQPQPSAPGQASASVPVYKPPLRGAPKGRIGGGTRGVGTDTIVLSVLAPDHAGLTASEQPSLYWYISTPTAYPVELTVMDPRTTEPLLEARLAGPIEAGLHRFRLAEQGIRLEPDVPYRWYVAVVLDPERRAKDVLAGGVIERVALPEKVRQRLAQARKEEAPSIYAEDGLWYDALTAASDLVDAAPGDPAPRRERAALLSQVGLRDVRE
jgi:hypothetical protein